jgi:hypothetical protein
MRFMLEHNIPAFLGMSGDIRSDLGFILNHSDFLDESPEMKLMAIKYMLQSKRCSHEQTATLERSLDNLQKKVYASR